MSSSRLQLSGDETLLPTPQPLALADVFDIKAARERVLPARVGFAL
jgi:hypothetical protein